MFDGALKTIKSDAQLALERAADIMERRGLCRGAFEIDGKICTMAAIAKGVYGADQSAYDVDLDSSRFIDAVILFKDRTGIRTGEGVWNREDPIGGVCYWNNTIARDTGDVVQALRKAAS